MKKFISGLLVGALISTSVSVFAAGIIKSASYNTNKVIFDGKILDLGQYSLITVQDQGDEYARNYMPLRAVIEQMGYSVGWNGATGEISIDPIQTQAPILPIATLKPASTLNPNHNVIVESLKDPVTAAPVTAVPIITPTPIYTSAPTYTPVPTSTYGSKTALAMTKTFNVGDIVEFDNANVQITSMAYINDTYIVTGNTSDTTGLIEVKYRININASSQEGSTFRISDFFGNIYSSNGSSYAVYSANNDSIYSGNTMTGTIYYLVGKNDHDMNYLNVHSATDTKSNAKVKSPTFYN